MAYNIIKYGRYSNDAYVYIQKMPGIYNQKLSLYFAYMYSIFDFKFRYIITGDTNLKSYTDARLFGENFNYKDKDILNILKSKNYEI